jgi:hypothetical protein
MECCDTLAVLLYDEMSQVLLGLKLWKKIISKFKRGSVCFPKR